MHKLLLILTIATSFSSNCYSADPNESNLDLETLSKMIEEQDEEEDLYFGNQESNVVLADLGERRGGFHRYERIRNEFHDAVRGGNARRVAELLRSGEIKPEDIKMAKETAHRFRLYDVQDVLNKYTSIGNNHGGNGGGNFGHNNIDTNQNLSAKFIDAVNSNDIQLVKRLLARGANINQKSQFGSTPLMSAVTRNHIEMVRFLLAQGANKSIMNTNGLTALTIATRGNKIQIVKLLLSYGANPAEGRPSAHEIARQSGNRVIMEMFRNSMIQPR